MFALVVVIYAHNTIRDIVQEVSEGIYSRTVFYFDCECWQLFRLPAHVRVGNAFSNVLSFAHLGNSTQNTKAVLTLVFW